MIITFTWRRTVGGYVTRVRRNSVCSQLEDSRCDVNIKPRITMAKEVFRQEEDIILQQNESANKENICEVLCIQSIVILVENIDCRKERRGG